MSLSHSSFRKEQPFEHHIVALSMLINHSKQSKDNTLQEYILAACVTKNFQRITNEKFSKPLIDSLRAIIGSPIDFKCASPQKNSSDHQLHSLIPDLASKLNIPNLLIQSAKTEAPLYTADTCTEFHRLLCNLLETFESHLRQLQSTTSGIFSV